MKEDDILRVKKRYETSLLAIRGVVGLGIGETEHRGRHIPCIRVYVERINEELEKQLPKSLDGFPVAMVEVGKAILY